MEEEAKEAKHKQGGMCFIATRKILGFYISVVNSSRRNVLKEGYDSKDGKGKVEAAEKIKGPSLSCPGESKWWKRRRGRCKEKEPLRLCKCTASNVMD